jgi:cytochrome c-type biogenesis protein CcmH/NrfF
MLALLAPLPAAADGEAAPAPTGHAAGMSDGERDRQAEAISRTIMSPFCPGRTVSACPNAGPWRDDIRRWVGEGVDANEIKRRLAERVPEHNLAGIPKNRLGWVLPVGLGLGAVGILVFLLRYLVSPRPTGSAEAASSKGAARSSGARAGAKSGKAKPAEAAGAAVAMNESDAADPSAPAALGKGRKVDWDAQLDRELETLD